MPSAAKYHEVTLYILRMLLEVHEQELVLEQRRLRIHFIEPINTVHKGIAKAKAELLKKREHQHMINYRLYGDRDYKSGDIVFRLETYTRDINRVSF